MKTSTTALTLAILAASSQVAVSTLEDKQGLRRLSMSLNSKSSKTSKNSKSGSSCLKAKMNASNGYAGDVEGTIEVCFGDLSANSGSGSGSGSGSLLMKVKGLSELVAAGVHIHAGTSCDDTISQGGHYWNTDVLKSGGPKDNGDAWFNMASSLAPTGTGYSTDEDGEGVAYFFFNNGFGYNGNVGHAVVIHDEVAPPLGNGDYARIACGILE